MPSDGQSAQRVIQPTGTDATEYYVRSLVGLVAMVGMVILLTPFLVALTRPPQQLSAITFVFILMAVWLLIWLGTELVWKW